MVVGVFRHPQHRLPGAKTGVELPVDLRDAVWAYDGVDHRLQRARVHALPKSVESVPVRSHEDAVNSQIAVDRLLQIAGQLDDRAHRTALPHAYKALGKPPAPDKIRNRVQQAADLSHRGTDDVALLSIYHDLDPELTKKRVPALPRGGNDPDTSAGGKLDEQPPDTPARPMHKRRLAGAQRQSIEQLERGRARQRNRRRLDHAKRLRARSNPSRLELGVLGVRAPASSPYGTDAPDRIAAAELRNPRSDLFDPPSELVPDHEGRLDPGPTRIHPIAGIDRINSCHSDLDENSTGTHGRPLDVRKLKVLGRSRLTDYDHTHVAAEATARTAFGSRQQARVNPDARETSDDIGLEPEEMAELAAVMTEIDWPDDEPAYEHLRRQLAESRPS